MKPSAYFINTSRGKIVDEPTLIKALEEKRIAGAGIDVFEKEPAEKDNPLLKMDTVIVLPHTACNSDYAFSTAPINIAQEIGRVLSGKLPNNIVNKSVKPGVKLVKGNYYGRIIRPGNNGVVNKQKVCEKFFLYKTMTFSQSRAPKMIMSLYGRELFWYNLQLKYTYIFIRAIFYQ